MLKRQRHEIFGFIYLELKMSVSPCWMTHARSGTTAQSVVKRYQKNPKLPNTAQNRTPHSFACINISFAGLSSSFCFKSSCCIHPITPIIQYKTASAARHWTNSSPPNTSDDLCLFFFLYNSSIMKCQLELQHQPTVEEVSYCNPLSLYPTSLSSGQPCVGGSKSLPPPSSPRLGIL